MNRKSLLLIWISVGIILIASVATVIQAQSAKEIIEASRKVIFKGIKPNEVKGFYLKKAITLAKNKQRFEMEKELKVSFPSKLKLTLKAPFASLYEKNEALMTEAVVNGEKVKIRIYYDLDGEIITQEQAVKESPLSKKDKQRRLEQIESNRKKQETRLSVQENIWSDVYPLLLQGFFEWDKNRLIKYAGKAKIGTKQAYILEFLPKEKERMEAVEKSINFKTRLFLDEQSKLLVMLITEASSPQVGLKVKYLFSDYQLIDGLLVAKKINTEAIATNKDGSKQRTIQRILVKDFKLNPNFKQDTFDVN